LVSWEVWPKKAASSRLLASSLPPVPNPGKALAAWMKAS
jgi:hypothetical protein